MSIRGRLIFVIGAILVLGFFTTNWISFRVSSATLKATILQNELPLTSSNIYAEIQTDLLRPIFVSSLMSNDTFLKDWALAGENDVAVITRYLEEIRRQYDVFTSFFISERTRNYYHFTGLSRVVQESNPEDAWFFRVRAMKEPYEINIDFNIEQDRAITIYVNYRVLDYQGNFLGLTGVGLKLDTVANIISRYRDNYKRNIYFIDASGRVTVRSEGALIAEDNIRDAPGISRVADRLLAANDGYFEYERGGETMLITTRLIPDLGWRVIVEQSESEVMRALWRSFLINLAIGVAIIVVTIATIGYAVNIYHRNLEDMAVTDKLTGIGNRQFFDTALARALERQRLVGEPFAVILFDLDHFKEINDAYGHLKGDEAIRRIAQAMRRLVRASDVLCRWGGEEIIILARNCRLGHAHELAEKLRAAVAAEPLFAPDDGKRLTLSAGVAESLPGDTADSAIGRADLALYRAKQAGRNRVVAEAEPQPA